MSISKVKLYRVKSYKQLKTFSWEFECIISDLEKQPQMTTQCAFHCCCAQSYPTLCDSIGCSPPVSVGSLSPWDFPGMNTGVGCHFLLQGIFPTQGWKRHLLHRLHLQVDSLPLHHLVSTSQCTKASKEARRPSVTHIIFNLLHILEHFFSEINEFSIALNCPWMIRLKYDLSFVSF